MNINNKLKWMNTNYYIKVSVTNFRKKSQSIQLKYNYKKNLFNHIQ